MGAGWKGREFAEFPLQPLLHKSLTTKQQKKKNDISKQHSKQAKKGEVERNSTKCLLTWFS